MHIYPALRYHISDHSLTAACKFRSDNTCIGYAVKFSYPPFYLRQLDAKAPYLHLLVTSADELYIAVRKIAADITCEVHFFVSVDGKNIVRDKLFFSKLVTSKISPAHRQARNSKLTNRTRRQKPTAFVKYIYVAVAKTLSDRHALIPPVYLAVADIYRTLCRTVGVDKIKLRRLTRYELLAANGEHPHIRALRICSDILPAKLCRAVHHRYPVAYYKLVERCKVKPCFLGDDINRCTACKRRIHILHRGIKAERTVCGKSVLVAHTKALTEGYAEIHKICVLEHTPLGLSR